MGDDDRTANSDQHDLRLLTPDQLCELLQVRKSWVYDQVEAGRLPHLRLGNQLPVPALGSGRISPRIAVRGATRRPHGTPRQSPTRPADQHQHRTTPE